MNYKQAFTFVFDDADWVQKILIAGLIALIPILGPIYLMGWSIEIIRRIKADRRDVLPRTHFSEFLGLGVKAVLISIVYALPAGVLNGFADIFQKMISEDHSFITNAMGVCFTCVGRVGAIALAIAAAMMAIVAMIRLAERDTLTSAFEFREVYEITLANWKQLLIVALMCVVASAIYSAGSILCFVGLIFTKPYGMTIYSSLVAQVSELLRDPAPRERKVRNSAPASDDLIEKPFGKEPAPAAPDANWVDPVLEPIEEKTEAAAEAVEDAVEEAGETIETASEDVKEAAEDILEDVREDIEEASDEDLPPAE